MPGRTLYNPRQYVFAYDNPAMGVAHLTESILSFERPANVHGHAEWQVLGVIEGQARLRTEDALLDLSPGSVCVIHPECRHHLEPTAGTLAVHLLDLRYIADPEDPFCRCLAGTAREPVWTIPVEGLHQILKGLREVIKPTGASDLPTIMSLLWRLLARPTRTTTPTGDRSVDPRIARAVNAMLRSLQDPLSTEDLARTLDISSSHLRRLFQQQLNTTPTDYQLRLRIEQAQRWLRLTTRNVAQIAASVGFPNQSHFCRVFRQHVGCAPLEYRRRAAAGQVA